MENIIGVVVKQFFKYSVTSLVYFSRVMITLQMNCFSSIQGKIKVAKLQNIPDRLLSTWEQKPWVFEVILSQIRFDLLKKVWLHRGKKCQQIIYNTYWQDLARSWGGWGENLLKAFWNLKPKFMLFFYSFQLPTKSFFSFIFSIFMLHWFIIIVFVLKFLQSIVTHMKQVESFILHCA